MVYAYIQYVAGSWAIVPLNAPKRTCFPFLAAILLPYAIAD